SVRAPWEKRTLIRFLARRSGLSRVLERSAEVWRQVVAVHAQDPAVDRRLACDAARESVRPATAHRHEREAARDLRRRHPGFRDVAVPGEPPAVDAIISGNPARWAATDID